MVRPRRTALAGIQERRQVLGLDLRQVPRQDSGRSPHALEHGPAKRRVVSRKWTGNSSSSVCLVDLSQRGGRYGQCVYRKQLMYYTIRHSYIDIPAIIVSYSFPQTLCTKKKRKNSLNKTSHNPDSQSSPRLKYLPHFLNGRSPSKHSYLQTVSCGVVLRAEPSSLAF